MTLALDGSSPAAVGSTSATQVTASFTPPAGSLIVAHANADGNTSGHTLTFSDSLGGTEGSPWVKVANPNGTTGGHCAIASRTATGAALTVTVVNSDSGATSTNLQVFVYTGSSPAMGASATGAYNGNAPNTMSGLTTTHPNTIVSYAVTDFQAATAQSSSDLTETTFNVGPNFITGFNGYKTVSAAGAVTANYSVVGNPTINISWVGVEVYESAISVAQWVEPSNGWFASATPKTLAVSWGPGDRIVIVGGIENNSDGTFDLPTLSGFTVSPVVLQDAGAAFSECLLQLWTTDAATSSGSGNVSVNRGTGGARFGCGAWVITGNPDPTNGVNSGNDNLTNAALSLGVGSGSILCFLLGDWNASNGGNTAGTQAAMPESPLTGSGTATERRDQGDGQSWAQHVVDWVGTSAGTFSFGSSNYAITHAGQVAVEIKTQIGGAPPPAPPSVYPRLGRRRI